MFKWEKLGKVFDPTTVKDKYWINEYAQAPATLVFHDFVRVYFSCRAVKDAKNQFISHSAFIDLDKKNLFKINKIADNPILNLGNKGCFDEFGTYPFSAIRKGNEIWGYYAGWTRCESVPFNTAIGLSISYDNGINFIKQGEGPVLSYSIDEPFIISGPKIRYYNDKFHLFYISGERWISLNGKAEMVTKIRCAVSEDGINWQKLNKNLITDKLIGAEAQASPDVIFAHGKYHMFFCYWSPINFRDTKYRRIGYAYSFDLINWNRDDSMVGLDVSKDGFDNEMIAYPHVFELDENIYMLYLGNEVGRYGFGLAKLKGDLI